LIEVKRGISSNATVPVGHRYKPGVYFAEVIQGNSKITLKLMKDASD
jgi:hypothetical protein